MHIWTTLKIFISSTFKDLELERDQLVQIFNRLQQKIFERRLHIIPYDLRWREQTEDDLVRWCINMVNQCDYFIGILGYRYGWRPPHGYDAVNQRNISITEMEIETALKVIPRDKRLFFFGDLAQCTPQDLAKEASEDLESMKLLKEKLKQQGEKIIEYKNTQELLLYIEKLLIETIDKNYPPGVKVQFEKYSRQDALLEIIEEKRRGFVGQQKHLDFLQKFSEENSFPNFLALEAVAGTGKSALLAEFIYLIQQKKVAIIAHYMSMSGDSRSPQGILQNLGEQLEQLGWIASLERTPEEIQKQVHEILAQSTKPLIIAIDGIDEMDEEGHNLLWLPKSLPHNVRVVITTRPVEIWEKLQKYTAITHFKLPHLEEIDIRSIINQYRSKVSISKDDEDFLVKRASGSPLFLKVSLDEMVAGGIAVGQLAETVEALFHQILRRLQDKYGEKIVSFYLGLISASRSGLMEAELREILYKDFASVIADDFLLSLQKSLANFVIQREKLLAFFHPEFERSVKMWLGKGYLRSCHSRLSLYFSSKGYLYERSLSELAYQTQWAEDYEKLLSLFADLEFLENKCASDMLTDLRHDMNFAIESITVPLPSDLKIQIAPDIFYSKKSLLLIAKIIDLNYHFLLRHPECLLQSLWNYGYWHDAPEGNEYYLASRKATEINLYKIVEFWKKNKEQKQNWVWIQSLCPLPEPLQSATLKIFRGHENMVSSVRFNSREDTIISCSVDSSVRIWDIDSGECSAVLKGHNGYISGVCFVDNETKIASSSEDTTIKVWDIKNGQCVFTLEGHENHVSSITSNSEGKYIISGSKDKTIRIWDIESQKCIRTLIGHTKTINSVFLSHDGETIISGAWDNTIRIWNFHSGECTQVLKEHTDHVKSVCMNQKGDLMFSASKDFTARVWDVKTGKCLHILPHKSCVFNIACTDDGASIATAAFGVIRIWDSNTGECFFKSHGHESAIFSICISKQGNRIISGSSDKTIRYWDSENRIGDVLTRGHEDNVHSVSFSKNAQLAVTSSKDLGLKIWDVTNGKNIQSISSNEIIRFACFLKGDKFILSVGENKELYIWEIATGLKYKTLQGHEKVILCVATSEDEKFAVSGGRDRLVCIWDLNQEKCLHKLKGHTEGGVRSVAIKNDHSLVASGGEDYTIRIWDVVSGECLSILEGHEKGIVSIAFLEGEKLISSARDNTIRIWNLATKECISTYEGAVNVEQFLNSNPHYAVAQQLETSVNIKESQTAIAFFPSILRQVTLSENNHICGFGGSYAYFLKVNGLVN